MAFIVKKHSTDEVYDLMCSFWDLHKFPRINRLILPENTFVVYRDDTPIYTTCIYWTDSKLAWLAWPISNKNASHKLREGGLVVLTNHIINYAKKKGLKMIITTSNTDSIVRSLESTGFELGDRNVDHHIKMI